jgi:hypothetical protein
MDEGFFRLGVSFKCSFILLNLYGFHNLGGGGGGGNFFFCFAQIV